MNDIVLQSHETDLNRIDRIIRSVGTAQKDVIAILQAIQSEYHYLPEDALNRICEITDITPAQLHGVASFYGQFRMVPAGKHRIKVCIGTACHVMGADKIYDAFKSHLEIPEDQDTDSDRLFTVDKVACLGCCMLAPAVQIDDITYGFVTTEKIPNILKDFLSAISQGKPGKRKGAVSEAVIEGEIRTCLCSSCVAAGATAIHDQLKTVIQDYRLPVKVRHVGCTGQAFLAPLVDIYPKGGKIYRYGRVQADQLNDILFRHFKPGSLGKRTQAAVNHLLERIYSDGNGETVVRFQSDPRQHASNDWHRQPMVTDTAGMHGPLSLNDYTADGGFSALKQCLQSVAPEMIIETIKKSGLRGRGGGGFETWRKWDQVRVAKHGEKRLICNGDEGDPGAFMDRMIMESFPFRVIEGLVIASWAVGANEGHIYVRAEYPLAIKRMESAIQLCKDAGYLGKHILDSGHDFSIHLSQGAGAFVCGEETALIAAIEGRRGMPRIRPPYPAESGLWNHPTLVNNVETYSLVPWILRHGADRFSRIGTESSKGTKTFALAGKIRKSGLVEVPMGTTLREIVETIGGGIPNGHQFKAVQVGGPSGGCVPEHLADTPVDYSALLSAGAMMGSGGLVVLDETDCMVDIARYFMTFTQAESCGKCSFCRIGTKRMIEILTRLTEGKARKNDLEQLESLARSVQTGSLCGLGRSAPNPVLSTLQHFRDEYEAHVNGRCPAGKCKALITYSINDDCIGCTRCAQRCPADAIQAKPHEKHEIDPEKCVRCGSCFEACPVDAVIVK